MFTHLLTSKTLRTLAALACAVGLAEAGSLRAADPLPPPAPPAKPVALSDVALARAALAAFDADPVLKEVNVLVSVVDRAAVIGGPVSSEELKKRLEAVVRTVPGIVSVKNVCFIEADPDPLLRAVADRMKPGAKPAASAPLPGVALPPTVAEGYIPPVPAQPPTDLVAAAPGKTVVAQTPNILGAPVIGVLGAPVAPAGTSATAKAHPLVPATAPGALTGAAGAKAADVLTAVAAIRAADARFARLTAEVKPDGGLFVTGAAAKAEDAWDFAGAVRKVPGVARVVLDPNLVK